MRWATLLLIAAILAVTTSSATPANASRPVPSMVCPPVC